MAFRLVEDSSTVDRIANTERWTLSVEYNELWLEREAWDRDATCEVEARDSDAWKPTLLHSHIFTFYVLTHFNRPTMSRLPRLHSSPDRFVPSRSNQNVPTMATSRSTSTALKRKAGEHNDDDLEALDQPRKLPAVR